VSHFLKLLRHQFCCCKVPSNLLPLQLNLLTNLHASNKLQVLLLDKNLCPPCIIKRSIQVHHSDSSTPLRHHYLDPAIDRQNYLAFQEASMNSSGSLTWEFTPLAKYISFINLTLLVTPQGIQTSLFEKQM
jgi:hypothetical protein